MSQILPDELFSEIASQLSLRDNLKLIQAHSTLRRPVSDGIISAEFEDCTWLPQTLTPRLIEFPHLQKLCLSDSKNNRQCLRNEDVSAIVSFCPQLHTLDVGGSPFLHGEALVPLRLLTHLTWLDVSRCVSLDEHALLHISGCCSLRHVNISGWNSFDEWTNELANSLTQLPFLTSLHMVETCRFYYDFLKCLAESPCGERLRHFHYSELRRAWTSRCSPVLFPQLLTLSGNSVAGCIQLPVTLTSLKCDIPCFRNDLLHLVNLTELEYNGRILEYPPPNLKSLTICSGGATEAAIWNGHAPVHLESLTIRLMTFSSPDSVFADLLRPLTALRELTLTDCEFDSLEFLSILPRTLVHLSLSLCRPTVTVNELQIIGKMNNLTYLDISTESTSLQNRDLENMFPCWPTLTLLNVSGHRLLTETLLPSIVTCNPLLQDLVACDCYLVADCEALDMLISRGRITAGSNIGEREDESEDFVVPLDDPVIAYDASGTYPKVMEYEEGDDSDSAESYCTSDSSGSDMEM